MYNSHLHYPQVVKVTRSSQKPAGNLRGKQACQMAIRAGTEVTGRIVVEANVSGSSSPTHSFANSLVNRLKLYKASVKDVTSTLPIYL